MDESDLKARLRAAALARRAALDDQAREATAQCLATFADIFEVTPDTVVAGYMPMRGEADPLPLMRRLASRGARLALPVVVARETALRFRAWREGEALVAGPHGTRHPEGAAPDIVPHIVLAPLAAFDRRGHRIGYGGGYYDRTLAGLRARGQVTAAGVAFATQEVETVPASPHDALLDLVLTEVGPIDFRS
ncbi:MAG: 5-formyltetrahydrofolate cyclo-ligase [Xanthobacteraceae bacterium]|nr:5-formyltetrahydrofolate cyclo-ligase [Xanthobacteraceae bacterium]